MQRIGLGEWKFAFDSSALDF